MPNTQQALEKQRAQNLAAKAVKATKKEPLSMMKKLVIFCLVNGIAWVWCSYILAFLGFTNIAETLSQVAITEIIGVILVYALKSLFENLSKNNSWPDKQSKVPLPVQTPTSTPIEDVVQEESTQEFSWDNWDEAVG